MKFLPLIALLLASCASDARLARVENRQDYVIEIVRNRRMSADRCKAFSDDGMMCRLAQGERCRCGFAPDDQDRENVAFEAAVARAQKQAAEALEEAEAEPTEGAD